MLNLAEYRKRPRSLANFLPWAALVSEGVVLNKDGSLQRAARFRGRDLDTTLASALWLVPAPDVAVRTFDVTAGEAVKAPRPPGPKRSRPSTSIRLAPA